MSGILIVTRVRIAVAQRKVSLTDRDKRTSAIPKASHLYCRYYRRTIFNRVRGIARNIVPSIRPLCFPSPQNWGHLLREFKRPLSFAPLCTCDSLVERGDSLKSTESTINYGHPP